ncbi:MAG: DEAD/DEAH box helicase, partial [Chloroflexi bacterium]|nr:DEAD/DEAH box helicase [Chloroflexota bacterium]
MIEEEAEATTTDQPAPAGAAPVEGFAAFGLHPALLEALAQLGYEEPTPVQHEAIPPLLEGRDVLAEAPTGTGKTAAFALPTLHRIAARGNAERRRGGGPQALILVPTRELAMQVAQAVHRYGRDLGTQALPIFGGQAYGQQLRGLERGVDVVVATPGRALDHLQRGSLVLAGVHTVILDEADEMLDMGFAEDLEALLGATPAERQTALFSATISPAIARIAGRHLRKPVRVTVAHKRPKGEDVAKVRQVAYVVARAHKLGALCRLLDVEAPASALIFARTRTEVDQLGEALGGRGYRASPLHGGMAQEQRDRVMNRFRSGDLEVLVATDVAARGLDIPQVSHVINYDVPSAPEAYVHRIGRTGRAGREGVAITLVEPREHRLLRNIEAFTRTRLELGRLPTLADLRERRLEVLQATLRETLLGDGFDRYRGVIEPLSEEFDLVDIALAAVSLADPAGTRAEDEVELPTATLPQPFARRPDGPRPG